MEEVDRFLFNGLFLVIDFSCFKEEVWLFWVRDWEVFLEDVFGYTSIRDVNILSLNGLGGIKGKWSEWDRDVKVKEGGVLVRLGLSNVKGEWKMKIKFR